MQHAPSFLATVAISLALAYLGAVAARRLRLPPLVGYLCAGVVIGPFTPGFVADPEIIAQLAQIGVALLLFGVGIHFSLADLATVWRVAVPGALIQVVLSICIAFFVGRALFGWSAEVAIVLAVSLGVASTAVATRTLEGRGQLSSPAGRIALGWLVMQDLAVILALVLLPSAARTETDAAALLLLLGGKLLKVGIFVAVVLLAGRKLVPLVLAWTARDGSRELFRLAVIVVALGIAYASARLADVSLALGAFFAGVVIAESDLSHQATAESVPVQQVFTVLFFVSIGMLFDPAVLVRAPLQVLALVMMILLGMGGVTLAILIGLRVAPAAAVAVAAGLAQIGEFSFILTGLAVTGGSLPSQGRDLVLGAAIVTIVANPFLFKAAEAGGPRLERWPLLRRWRRGDGDAAAQAAVTGLSNHVILVGHGRVGSAVAAALGEEGVPYVVVEQNLRLARVLREQGVPAIYGDAGWPEVLGAARPETARLLIVAIPASGSVRRIVQAAREANPDLPFVVRTHSDREADWLARQAVSRVVMGERRTAAEIARHAIDLLRLPDDTGSGKAADKS